MMSLPLAVVFGYKSGHNKMFFVGRDGDIKFEMQKHCNHLIKILALCNGHRPLSMIREKISILSDKDFQDLIALAEEFGIIKDSRELYLGFHEDSANPLIFSHNMSSDEVSKLVSTRKEVSRSASSIELLGSNNSSENNLLRLCSTRKSTRIFTGEHLTLEEVSGLLKAMYTVGEQRSIPSAGQLYPLNIHIAVTSSSSDSLSRGLYQYDPVRLLLNPIGDVQVTPDIIARILNSYQAELAGLVVFVSADLQRPASKYSNRGYRFALMEVGHVGQNAHLYCSETSGLGMVEYGGFQDKLASEFLSLDYPKQSVLLTIIVGKEDQSGQPIRSYFSTAWNLSKQLIGKHKPIKCVYVGQPSDGNYKLPRIETIAQYNILNFKSSNLIPKEERFGSGLAVTSDESMVKALAEAYERYVSGDLRVDEIGSAKKLKNEWLDPRKIVPLQSFAYKRYDWKRFNPNHKWQWVKGKRYNSGNPVMVPVDIVFYPLSFRQLNRNQCFSCNSNGVAAHTDWDVAVEKALLELIERDAISVTWYGKREVRAIPVSILCDDIKLRMQHWIDKGWKVKFLNLTLDSVPVVLAVIFSENMYPSFVAGASANLDWNTAITKAWDEAEIFLLNWRRRRKVAEILLEEMYSPLDHGNIYFRRENLAYVKWLLDAKEEKVSPPSILKRHELAKSFNPVVVDLNPTESDCDLKVVRVISESLIPINFGYGNEHFGHRRFSDLGLKWKREFPSFPHFFA